MKIEFKTDPNNGYLLSPKGDHYRNEYQIYSFEFLGLCVCGDNVSAYNLCRKILKIFDSRNEDRYSYIAEDKIKELISENIDTTAHIFSHIFHYLELLEHGSSVGSSWLDMKGEMIVDAREVTRHDLDEQ